MIVIRKDVNLDQHIDFIVRREKVRVALEYKIAHDPHYADLILNNDALNHRRTALLRIEFQLALTGRRDQDLRHPLDHTHWQPPRVRALIMKMIELLRMA